MRGRLSVVIIVLVYYLVFFAHISDAQETVIKCSDSVCAPEVLENFFPADELWYPGKKVVRNISVLNETDSSQFFSLQAVNTYVENNLDNVFHFIIEDGRETVLWSGSLHQFILNGETIVLRQLLPGQRTLLRLITYMYSSSDNRYQNGVVQYNLEFGVSDGIVPPRPPCINTATLSPPQNITIVSAQSNTLTLAWDELTQDHTGYEVQWRRQDEADWHMIRLGKATDVLIGGLLPYADIPYVVRMRGLTDCGTGDVSAEVIARYIPRSSPTPSAPTTLVHPTSQQEKSSPTETQPYISHDDGENKSVSRTETGSPNHSDDSPTQLVFKEPKSSSNSSTGSAVLGITARRCTCRVNLLIVQMFLIIFFCWTIGASLLFKRRTVPAIIGCIVILGVALATQMGIQWRQSSCDASCAITESMLLVVGGIISCLVLLQRGK